MPSKLPSELQRDRDAALAFFPLPPEIVHRLDIYAELLRKWQKTINLVAASTLPHLWTRHIADSLQVQAAVPQARLWADLGSGGGFPGLVTAIRLAETPGARMHLIESDQRKCAFLREVSRETSAPAVIHNARIEKVIDHLGDPIEAVSARALAPLRVLLTYAENLLARGAVGVFLKGQDADRELKALSTTGRYRIMEKSSVTASVSRLLLVYDEGAKAASARRG
ncbi:16S rRNA (guanine527-N7)-methyltransferase [Methylovirgula ligni]|uniref:Ribosomal RNA small subunit methyltransferase G n=1 Tax=Methylovirgula ligni TaxID=569860 RepID=A0A3D9Z302_9HYPH|nr:16S rRNA (guanine(527)-N(7))-methyltransferase RsmG [Methylovirgula ligni]REF89543.1 16S rRNA (guanine527-N7)-methyltransferase [Methylovirgula ligni]